MQGFPACGAEIFLFLRNQRDRDVAETGRGVQV
jgi:hypothetical protein